jgi:hypothetical protein
MTQKNDRDRSIGALVDLFTSIAVSQDEALLDNDTRRFKRLYERMGEVEGELKSREGDERRALTALYKHANAQVRLTAAIATLAIAPEEARSVLQSIRKNQEHPQALEAGMTIRGLDSGEFKPT